MSPWTELAVELDSEVRKSKGRGIGHDEAVRLVAIRRSLEYKLVVEAIREASRHRGEAQLLVIPVPPDEPAPPTTPPTVEPAMEPADPISIRRDIRDALDVYDISSLDADSVGELLGEAAEMAAAAAITEAMRRDLPRKAVKRFGDFFVRAPSKLRARAESAKEAGEDFRAKWLLERAERLEKKQAS